MVEIDDNNDNIFKELTINDVTMLLQFNEFKNNIFLNNKLVEFMQCIEVEN